MRGVDAVADAVKGTLGAGGYNALIEDPRPPFTVATNDGVSVANAIELDDPIEKMGANLTREIGKKSERETADGTTSTITLFQAILHEANKLDASPMEIKKSLEECLPIIIKSIDDQTKEITVDEVGQVASISAEDEKMGATIQEIYKQIGKDGILYPDISKTFEDYYTLGKGVKIDMAGFASPYMADLSEDGRFLNTATFKNPRILITKQKISSAEDLNALAGALFAKEIKELVIFADDFEVNVVTPLVMTRAKNGFKFLLIKMPTLWKDWWFTDLAKLTGATVIDPAAGISFKTIKLEHLGTCGSITSDKNDTYLDGTLDVTEHIKTLEAEGDDDSKIRIARMNTKTARFFIGAHSDTALSYKRLKLDDARGAVWSALHGGIVPGGGVTLMKCRDNLPDTIGGKILLSALLAPIFQIMQNAGLDMAIPTDGRGINAKTGEVVEMIDAGIVDPATVVKSVVQNAISVAAVVLTTQVVIHLPKKDPIDAPQMRGTM